MSVNFRPSFWLNLDSLTLARCYPPTDLTRRWVAAWVFTDLLKRFYWLDWKKELREVMHYVGYVLLLVIWNQGFGFKNYYSHEHVKAYSILWRWKWQKKNMDLDIHTWQSITSSISKCIYLTAVKRWSNQFYVSVNSRHVLQVYLHVQKNSNSDHTVYFRISLSDIWYHLEPTYPVICYNSWGKLKLYLHWWKGYIALSERRFLLEIQSQKIDKYMVYKQWTTNCYIDVWSWWVEGTYASVDVEIVGIEESEGRPTPSIRLRTHK